MSDEIADEGEAIRLARAGDREAFRWLVERHQGRAVRLALRVLRDEEAARDAAQEAFLKAWKALPGFRGRAAFGTWLYRLVMNQSLDARRRARARPGSDADWTHEPEPAVGSEPPRPPSPDVALDRAELRGVLAEALETLPESARTTLLLREVDGLSYAEIASALDIPKGTVMSRLHHARRRLREELEDRGVSIGEVGS